MARIVNIESRRGLALILTVGILASAFAGCAQAGTPGEGRGSRGTGFPALSAAVSSRDGHGVFSFKDGFRVIAFPPGRVQKIPIRIEGGHPYIPVYAKKPEPVWFLLDTGVSIPMVVGESTVERLAGVAEKQAREMRIVNSAGKVSASPRRVCWFSSLRVGASEGPWKCSCDAVIVEDANPLKIKDLIGLPFFEGCLVTLDYPARELRIERGELPEPDRQGILTCDMSGTPVVEIAFGDVPLPVEIDSGSNGAFEIPDRLRKRVRLRGKSVASPGTVESFGEISAAESWDWLVGDAHIGRYSIPGPPMTLTASSLETVRAGTQILEHFALTFDRKNGRVRVSRPPGHSLRVYPAGGFWNGDLCRDLDYWEFTFSPGSLLGRIFGEKARAKRHLHSGHRRLSLELPGAGEVCAQQRTVVPESPDSPVILLFEACGDGGSIEVSVGVADEEGREQTLGVFRPPAPANPGSLEMEGKKYDLSNYRGKTIQLRFRVRSIDGKKGTACFQNIRLAPADMTISEKEGQ